MQEKCAVFRTEKTLKEGVEEIRNTFNIINDFTPEEEGNIIRENKWIDQ